MQGKAWLSLQLWPWKWGAEFDWPPLASGGPSSPSRVWCAQECGE